MITYHAADNGYTDTTSTGTSWNVNLPSNMEVGNIVLMMVGIRCATSVELIEDATGWTEIDDGGGTETRLKTFWRKVDASWSGDTTAAVGISSGSYASAITVRVSGAVDPSVIAPTALSAFNDTNGKYPDPPKLTTSNTPGDKFWIAVHFHRDGGLDTDWPYPDNRTQTTGTVNSRMHLCTTQNTANNEDPGTFEINISGSDWTATTIVLHEYAIAPTKHPVIFTRTARKPVMAYRWIQGTVSQVTYGFAPAGEVPVTMAVWFYNTNAVNNDRNLMQIQDKDADNQYFRMLIGEDATPSNQNLSIYAKNVTSGAFYSTTTAESQVNRWHHGCGVFAASDSRLVYIDGGNVGTNTADTGEMASAVLDSITIGLEGDSTPTDPWDGSLVWPAVWNVALTPSEILLLSSGVSPHLVRPERLVFFAPLDGRPNDMRCLVTGEVPTSTTGLLTDTRLVGPPQLQGLQKIPLAVPTPNRRLVTF